MADHNLSNIDLTPVIGHTVSIGGLVSYYIGWLPAPAALIAFVWYAIQIYESNTVQNWRNRRRERKISRLKRQLAILEASRPPGRGDTTA